MVGPNRPCDKPGKKRRREEMAARLRSDANHMDARRQRLLVRFVAVEGDGVLCGPLADKVECYLLLSTTQVGVLYDYREVEAISTQCASPTRLRAHRSAPASLPCSDQRRRHAVMAGPTWRQPAAARSRP